MAGSEKYSSFGVSGIEDGLKGWHERQEKARERMKEGKYINKSLFFLTQVINRKTTGESSTHIPYRNASLTKILKSSLCGNAKTCVILCLSPSKSQFDHSLQTLKFGLSVSKIEIRAERNVSKITPEETLKLLIQEYQARLASLDKQPTMASLSGDEELKTENNMLWQQLITNGEKLKNKSLLQFYIEDPSTLSIGCLNEPENDSNLVKTLIEALKLSCKHCFYWKNKAQAYEKKFKEMVDVAANHQKQSDCLMKLSEVIEDYFKMIKSQAAKLEIYEYTEKWAQQLTSKDLTALASHFKRRLEQIQNLIPKAKKSNKIPPKLELNLKYNEQYIGTLFKEAKELNEASKGIQELEEILSKPYADTLEDKSLLNLIQLIKELLPQTKNNSELKISPLVKENECPSSPIVNWQRRELAASPKYGVPRTPNAKATLGYKNTRQRSPLKVRSRSSKPQGKTGNEMTKLGIMINQAVKISETPKESLTNYIRTDNTGTYGIGIFSHMHSLKQLKKNTKRQNKEELINSKSQNELVMEIKSSMHNENSKVLQSWHKDNIK